MAVKRRLTQEIGLSPKKGKLDDVTNSPVSSPIKGPLQEHVESDSPSFVAKCFYGIKKSHGIKNTKETTPVKKKIDHSHLRRSPRSIKSPANGTGSNVLSRVEQLMADRIASSPVKQRLFESCSKIEFRRIYGDEYKELEALVSRESQKLTRRSSRIMRSRREESESDEGNDFDEGDNAPVFSVNNSGLDNVEDSDSDSESGDEIVAQVHTIGNQENKEIVTGKANDDISKVIMHTDIAPNPGKKFFKSRTSTEDSNSKQYGVVCSKGFNFKVHPKDSAALHEKKMKRSGQRISPKLKTTPSPRGKIIPCNPFVQVKLIANENEDIDQTDSAIEQSSNSQSGFWFAPGFLSPARSDRATCESTLESLSLNKSNCNTYERTPPPRTYVLKRTRKVSHGNSPAPSDSAHSTPDSVDLIEPFPEKGVTGSEDLFSSPVVPLASTEEISCTQDVSSSNQNKQDETSGSGRKYKLFPVFTRQSARLASPAAETQSKRTALKKNGLVSPNLTDPSQSQMILDAGQKKFGATQCPVCNMVYCHADPEDEAAHSKFHKRLLNALRFPGSKKDRILQEYPDDLGQVVLVLPDDQKAIKKKVEDVNQVMSSELGFPDATNSFSNNRQKVFLYILEKEVAGCCVAEPISEGFRIIPGDLDTRESSGQRPWRCSDVPEPACVGVCRLWVAASYRKKGIATKLVDCVRQWFDYGTLIPLHRLAFSDPTPDGRQFAQKFFRSNTFLVYKYKSHNSQH